MQRREFMLKSVASLAAGTVLVGCTTTSTTPATPPADTQASQRSEIEQGVDAAFTKLYANVPDARNLVSKASGVLVFPNVIAAGVVVGGQYGKGALQVKRTTVGYYSVASASVGLQVGAQSKAIFVLFMTQDALNKFRASSGWSAGVDASVAVIKVGANGLIDPTTASGPVLAFVLTNAGLMANLSLEGTKITPLQI